MILIKLRFAFGKNQRVDSYNFMIELQNSLILTKVWEPPNVGVDC